MLSQNFSTGKKPSRRSITALSKKKSKGEKGNAKKYVSQSLKT